MIHRAGEPETAEKAALQPKRRRTALLLDRVGRLTARWITLLYRRWLYRAHMRFAHRFNWHWMPPIYPEKDTVLWCQWCGARYTLPRADKCEHGIPRRFCTALHAGPTTASHDP